MDKCKSRGMDKHPLQEDARNKKEDFWIPPSTQKVEVKYPRQRLLGKAWCEEQGNACRSWKSPSAASWTSHSWKIWMLWLGKRGRTQLIKILHGAEALSRG